MAGHSKWSNIKRLKAKEDAKRSKAFSKCAKEIISSVKLGGADPNMNPRLRLAIQRAKKENMPQEAINRNIHKGEGKGGEDFLYEVYGKGGVGILVEGVTDNRNRMITELRIVMNKRGGSLASPGSVLFHFRRCAQVKVSQHTRGTVFNLALESGADECEESDGEAYITIAPELVNDLTKSIEASGERILEVDVDYLPNSWVACGDTDAASNESLIAALEELEDVSGTSHNMEMKEKGAGGS